MRLGIIDASIEIVPVKELILQMYSGVPTLNSSPAIRSKAVAKAELSKALANIAGHLTPEEKASGMLGDAAVMVKAFEWVDSVEENLYVPDDRLKQKLAEYRNTITGRSKAENRRKGQLMEEIAVLAFTCIQGWDYMKSYPSYAEQHDLVVGAVLHYGKSHQSVLSAERQA